jgi:peptide-methionine (S)-S-oxide reductase
MNWQATIIVGALLAGSVAQAAPETNAVAKGAAHMEKATFAAGCFWGVESEFRAVKGVQDTAVGYTGGAIPNPTYEQVCTHATGHAEAVEVQFDPKVVTFEQLLDLFWKIHDPTQLDRQGPDVGSNYRSAIFCHTPEQQKAAQASLEKLQQTPGYYNRKIVTQIVAAAPFYRAEEYHQRYLEKHGRAKCHK